MSGIAADGYRAAFLVSVSEAERVVATSQPTPMPPHHKPLLNSQLRRTRLAGLTLHVCRFREEESTHAASRRERPQNAPRHRGRPSPWAQERDGYVPTIFCKLNPPNSCPVSALTHGPLCGPGCRFLRCYGYRRVILDDHLRTLGGPGRGVVSPGRYASGARSDCT